MGKNAAPSTRKQPQHPHAGRYKYLCEAFLRFLDRYLPGFSKEPLRVRLSLSRMIFDAPTRYRAHSHVAGHARYTYAELERMFGRGAFSSINARLGIFDIEKDAQGRPAWSKVKGHTRAFKLTAKVAELRDGYLARCTHHYPTRLLTEDGKHLRTLPASAVDAKNMDGQTRRGFKELPITPAVPVNLTQLKKLIRDIQSWLFEHEAGYVQRDAFHKIPDPHFLRDLQREAQMLVAIAHNQQWPDRIPHRYFEARSGRLYAEGAVNLQTCRRVVRQAALAGMYDVDIENCHYSVLAQMAAELGHPCTAIRAYLADKKGTRRALMDAFSISEGQAKQALIALIYGAKFSSRPKDALPLIFKSVELASKIYSHPQFMDLRDDIAEARRVVLTAQSESRGTIKNCRGLTIEASARPEERLAHLLQGVEAAALEAACRLCSEHIVLLQHDGFTSIRALDTAAIEAAMLKATGYRLQVEQKVVQVDLAEPFDKHEEDLDAYGATFSEAFTEGFADPDVTKTRAAIFFNNDNHLGAIYAHAM
jgi:hypothetical protein